MAKMTKAQIAQRAHDIEELRKIVKPGMTVYTQLKHVSRSGMYRVISLFVIADNRLIKIDHYACRLLEGWDDRHQGCKTGGCGMDMGFHLVYNLGATLYPNAEENKTFGVMTYRNGEQTPETSGGYLLKHSWM